MLESQWGSVVVCTGAVTAIIPAEQPQGPAGPLAHRPLVDAAEREKLLEEHLSEVRYIARRIHGRLPQHVPLEDLIHDGVLGLIEAVEKFDPRKQVQLKSYAKFRIRGAILDSLRASDWSPRSLRRQERRLREARQEMSAALGRSPTESELAGRLDMDLPAFQQLLTELSGLDLGSLQTPSGENAPEELPVRRPSDAGDDPFSLCLREEMKSHLIHAMDGLEMRERQVLELYYGDELTMREVGTVLSIGESRVSQIRSAAMMRLRGRLTARLRSHPAA